LGEREAMTSANFRDEPTTEVLDLYDVLPQADRTPARTEDDPVTTMIKGVGRNLAAIIGMFAVYLPAFIICTTLFSLGVGLIILGVGLIILVAALVVAGWSARMSRSLLAYAGHELPAAHYPAAGPGVRGKLRRLGHAQSWRDLLHVLVNFVLATFTFSVAVSWVAGGLGGVTYWFWSRWLPDDSEGLPNLLGFPGRFADITFNTVLGMILLLTTPMVLRGLMLLHVAVGRALLVDETPVLRQQVSELTESRTAAGVAEAQTLRRLERDLHDGPQQRLVRLGMDISAAQRRLADDPERARILLDEAWQQSQDALAEIRTLSRGIAPPILAEQGLPAAITALAARGSVPTSVDVEPLPLSDAAQNAAYFVVAEALANLEKHSQASQASVEVRRVGALAVVNVTDNGMGGASLAKGHGLAGLADRLRGVDGTLTVSSPVGGPTQLTATLPLG
jgi:signal transduction histidine kinase